MITEQNWAPIDLMLDSGAFSAWKRQEEIKVEDYAEYIATNLDLITCAVNLDVIPGKGFGHKPSQAEVEESAEIGWKNLLDLKTILPEATWIPVFHQGERFDWLQRMIGEGYSYVGISPANDRTTDQKQYWLDQVFKYICNPDGKAHTKTHAFGVTSAQLLARYPWYSVDSTSWSLWGAYGAVALPPVVGEDFSFKEAPLIVVVSKEAWNKGGERAGKHFEAYSPRYREKLIEYMAERGFTAADLAADYHARDRFNILYFQDLASYYTANPPIYIPKVEGFFSTNNSFVGGDLFRPPCPPPLKVIFSTNTTFQKNESLNARGVQPRLLSYYYLRAMKDPNWLRIYNQTGTGPEPQRRKVKTVTPV